MGRLFVNVHKEICIGRLMYAAKVHCIEPYHSMYQVEDKDMIEVPNPTNVEYKLRKLGDKAKTLITYAQGVEMFAKLYHVYDGDAKDGDDLGSQLYNLLSRTSADCDPALLNEVAAMVKKISSGIIADKGDVMHPHAIVLTDDRKLPVAVCSVHGELCTIRYVKASEGPTIEIYPVTVESEAISYREALESVCELMVIWKALSNAHLKWGERGSYILQAPEDAHLQVDGLTSDLRNCLRKLEAQFNQIGPEKLLFKLIHTPTAETIKAYSIATVKASVLDGILKQWEECEIGRDHAFKAPIITLHETIKNAAQMFKESKMTEHLDRQQLKVNVNLNKDAGVMANALRMLDDKHCPADYVVRKRLCFLTTLLDFPPADAPSEMKFNHAATDMAVKTLLRDVRECRWDRIIRNALLIAGRTNSGAQWLGSTVGFEDQGPFAVFWIDQLHHQCYARIVIGDVMYEIIPTI